MSERLMRDMEARIKELEAQINVANEGGSIGALIERLLKAEARIKEVEAERDDLLRLGNNHK
jgi:hypothetical protein